MLPYEALIIPLFFGFRDLGLLDSWWAVILPADRLQRLLWHVLDADVVRESQSRFHHGGG